MEWYVIILVINIIIALISTFLGIRATTRFGRELRKSGILITLLVILFVIQQILMIPINLATNTKIALVLISTAMSIDILFVALNAKALINSVDNHYKKK